MHNYWIICASESQFHWCVVTLKCSTLYHPVISQLAKLCASEKHIMLPPSYFDFLICVPNSVLICGQLKTAVTWNKLMILLKQRSTCLVLLMFSVWLVMLRVSPVLCNCSMGVLLALSLSAYGMASEVKFLYREDGAVVIFWSDKGGVVACHRVLHCTLNPVAGVSTRTLSCTCVHDVWNRHSMPACITSAWGVEFHGPLQGMAKQLVGCGKKIWFIGWTIFREEISLTGVKLTKMRLV